MVSGIVLTLLLCLVLPFSLKTEAATKQAASDGSLGQTPGPTSITNTVFTEDFESGFPGTSWTVGDWDANNGLDYWGATNYQSHTGSSSGWCAQTGAQTSYQTIFQENFEGSFPGTYWTVGDWNHNSGDDYWGATSYRSEGGSKSCWCAQVGTQTRTDEIFYDGFENNLGSSWTAWDRWSGDDLEGSDYWGCSTYRANVGACSAWCAAVGKEGPDGGSGEYNQVTHKYDDLMESILQLDCIIPSGYSSATLSFWYNFVNSEPNLDVLQVGYFLENGDSAWLPGMNWYYTPTNGWAHYTCSIPSNTYYIWWVFKSDISNHDYEGVYVDDVAIFATGEFPNSGRLNYDGSMEALMYIQVDLSQYSSVYLHYSCWVDCMYDGVKADYLAVIYYSEGAWHETDYHSGINRVWRYPTVDIPSSATAVGFKFFSNAQLQPIFDEGVYLDGITLAGIPNNDVVHKYDDNMNTYMYRAVDLSSYDKSVSLSFWYWLNCEAGQDYLGVMWSYDGSTWYYYSYTGNSNGWQHSTVPIYHTVQYVGFRFLSNGNYHDFEGAYIDDIVCTGTTYYHDIAVLDVKPYKTAVAQGYSVLINVTCKNQGEVQETFDVTLDSLTPPAHIQTKSNVVLASGASITITFKWDTTGFPMAQYLIMAGASVVPLEADTTNNAAFDGFVTVSIPGDANGDFKVNIKDAALIGTHWQHKLPPTYPNPHPDDPVKLEQCRMADINGDCIVNIQDATLLGVHWGESYNPP